ncbi:MAG: glycoside hydrolase family 3 C-terminal domain-containing protein [Fusicatenibacter sp.]|nr:glycoside hydrolase family 3 C-terminal domain-containing protein [Fusicatenibacter sp.]
MGKWQRNKYLPVLPLGKDGRRVTGSAEHIALSRKAAGEGMVLLKNEAGTLPLAQGSKVALFGKGTVDYVKGGGGSGDVTVAYIRNLYEGMKEKEAEGKVSLFHELPLFYEQEIQKQYADGAVPGMTREPEVPEELLLRAKAFADTAIITICRFSGEGWDRKCQITEEGYELFDNEKKQMELSASIFENGDFYLTNAEQALVDTVTANFAHVIVVMNVGGMVDTSWFINCPEIQSVLMAWQGGMEGGLAAADVLLGDVNPSGKLVDTYASSLEDYPSTENFHKSVYYVDYTEDIYVGYRYFETIPGAAAKVNYPFGFGLSYTEFLIEPSDAKETDGQIQVLVKVTNIGNRPGKEVVQLYCGAPAGLLGKPAKELKAYQKTRLLLPGETQTLKLLFPITSLASFDDLGKVCLSAYILEAGDYVFYVGNNVRDAKKIDYVYTVPQTRITEQCSALAVPHKLPKRMLSDGTYEELPMDDGPIEEEGLPRQDKNHLEGFLPETKAQPRVSLFDLINQGSNQPCLLDVAEGRITLDELIRQMSIEELIELLGGQPNTGAANTFGMGNQPKYGIPNIMTADGPAGLRINPECGVNTTAWPCATLLACTWDPQLIEQIGAAGASEVKENNIGIWLTPAVNIHRSPLCGRNFEYYSEDPLVAGKSGAAMVRGIQSMHIGASVKHFACNNKETNRKDSDSRVSQRALREIYLKAFEIIVKEADPYTIMSSYNLINGVQASENKDLLTGILRNEWGFRGMVTTDWWTHGEHYRETKAGNDIKMANGYPERVLEAYEKGCITREEIETCAKRILEMILRMD